RLADRGPVSAGFWRLALAIPFIALLARANRQPLVGMPRGVFLAVLLGGVFFGLDIASWHVGIGYTRLANAALFGNAGSLVLMVWGDRKSTRLNSSHVKISYAVFCLKKKKKKKAKIRNKVK